MTRDEGEEFRPPENTGVRSSNIGSFMPEGTYRPVPIVWFAGAEFVQIWALFFVFLFLSGSPPIFTLLLSGLITLAIGRWTFRRGMAQAATGWQIFTLTALALNWMLVSFGAFAMWYG